MGSAIASLTGKSAPSTPGNAKGAIGALISAGPAYRAQLASAAASKPVDPNTLGDTKALTAALNAKQITQQQFADRYNKLNNKPVGAPYSAKNTFSALGSALNQVVVKPAVALPKSAYDIGRGAAASVSGNKKALVNANKAKSTDNPQVLAPVTRPLVQVARTIEHPFTGNTFTPKSSNAKRVFGDAPVQNIASGVKSTAKTHGKLAGALYGIGQVGQDVAALAGLKGVGEGEGAVGATRNGIKSVKQAFIDGPKTTLQNSVTHVALQAGEKANTPVKIPVEGGDVSPSGVPVRTPIHAGIKDISSTTKIGVRTPNQMSDTAFTKEFNQLSKGYERDTKSLESLPTVRAKALTNSLETHYQTKLNDLLDRYHKPDLTAPVKPKTLATAVTNAKNYGGNVPAPRARSAFDRLAKQSADAQKAAEATGTQPKPVEAPQSSATPQVKATTTPTPKPVQTASEKPTAQSTPAGTEKVSGSALRTQQEAVQAGMKSEAQTTGATFDTVSHKAEATKAVDLVNNNPQKAMDIAIGKSRGDNVSHESAVYHAVKNAEIAKAKTTGDWSTVTDLANSKRHTAVSEHAQALGAEGYNLDPHDPVNIMNDIAKTRQKAVEGSAKTTVSKEATSIGKEVKTSTPKVTRQDWHSFIQELRCK